MRIVDTIDASGRRLRIPSFRTSDLLLSLPYFLASTVVALLSTLVFLVAFQPGLLLCRVLTRINANTLYLVLASPLLVATAYGISVASGDHSNTDAAAAVF